MTTIDDDHEYLGRIESGSRHAGIYKLRLYKSANNGLCSLSSIP
jgi:hypothetical protein